MKENQRCTCGVVAKSHPKSHIVIAYSGNELFFTPPLHHGKHAIVLQVAPANDGASFIVEFVYEDEYNDTLKEQMQ